MDELFRLAREAVKRQLVGTGVTTSPQPAATVTVPQPVPTPPAAPANGSGRKPKIKDPGLPATSKQIGLLKKLAQQKGRRLDDFTDLSMGEASAKIGELMAI